MSVVQRLAHIATIAAVAFVLLGEDLFHVSAFLADVAVYAVLAVVAARGLRAVAPRRS